ncbi:hypothetical protein C8J57DRAFT_1533817 [Mycena rebaudengoi]|nr:hypothetical protein C8J57DRAFT_1533817 [Mycena rebaudengoi]
MLKKEDIRCMEDAEKLSRDAQKRVARDERRRLREAELRLSGKLPPLAQDGDKDDEDAMVHGGENIRELLWIWTMAGTSGGEGDLEEALHIEWAKSFAQVRRWNKDVRLLKEEKRQHPISLEAHAVEWEQRASKVPTGIIPFADAEGMVAFTEPVLARGHKHQRRQHGGNKMDVEADGELEDAVNKADVSEDEEEDEDEEDEELRAELDDLRGDIVSDEESGGAAIVTNEQGPLHHLSDARVTSQTDCHPANASAPPTLFCRHEGHRMSPAPKPIASSPSSASSPLSLSDPARPPAAPLRPPPSTPQSGNDAQPTDTSVGTPSTQAGNTSPPSRSTTPPTAVHTTKWEGRAAPAHQRRGGTPPRPPHQAGTTHSPCPLTPSAPHQRRRECHPAHPTRREGSATPHPQTPRWHPTNAMWERRCITTK